MWECVNTGQRPNHPSPPAPLPSTLVCFQNSTPFSHPTPLPLKAGGNAPDHDGTKGKGDEADEGDEEGGAVRALVALIGETVEAGGTLAAHELLVSLRARLVWRSMQSQKNGGVCVCVRLCRRHGN